MSWCSLSRVRRSAGGPALPPGALPAPLQLRRQEGAPGPGPIFQLSSIGIEPPRPDDRSEVRQVAGSGLRTPGGRLPFLDQLQRSFGRHDLSGVRAHQGSEAQGSAQRIGARAFASGNDVVFGRTPDLFTAAHEAAHIVQQRSGVSVPGGIGAAGDTYEQQADAVAHKVVAGHSVESMLGGGGGSGASGGGAPIQMAWETAYVKRNTKFRLGDAILSGFDGWKQKQGLAAGSTFEVDFANTITSGNKVFVRARRWVPTRRWPQRAAYYEEGYIKAEALERFAHNEYEVGDKFFGLKNPTVGTRQPGAKYGYGSQVVSGDANYDDNDKPNAADFVNSVGGSTKPTAGRDLEMFNSYRQEPHWQNKPIAQSNNRDDDNTRNARRQGNTDIGIARASKVALLAAVRTRPNQKIRFLLDGLNMEDTVAKDNSKGHFGQSFTAHELRFVYRHWNDVFDGHVEFYLNGRKVPPPWQSNPALWAQYQPTHTYP